MEWADGKLTRAVLRNVSSSTGTCTLRYGDRNAEFAIPVGESREFNGSSK